jgi:hypothetical protein
MKRFRKYLGIAALYVVGLAIVLSTNPQRVSPLFLALPLLIFFVALFLTLLALMSSFARQRGHHLSRNMIVAASVTAAFPALLLLLQSIGELSLRDIITLILIIIVLGVYLSKIGFTKRPGSNKPR